MTLKDFLQSLARRWYVVLGGLLVTAVLCGAAYAAVSPGYERRASLLLLPGATSIPKEANPYLYLDGLGQASDVLVSALNADAVRDTVLNGYAGSSVMVERDFASSGPLLAVTAVGPSDADASDVLDRVLAAVPTTLSNLQTRADVPPEARITSLTLTQDPESTVVEKNRIQATVAVGAAGTALTLLLAGLVDGLLLSASRKRAVRGPQAVASSGGSGHEDEQRSGVRIPRLQNAPE